LLEVGETVIPDNNIV